MSPSHFNASEASVTWSAVTGYLFPLCSTIKMVPSRWWTRTFAHLKRQRAITCGKVCSVASIRNTKRSCLSLSDCHDWGTERFSVCCILKPISCVLFLVLEDSRLVKLRYRRGMPKRELIGLASDDVHDRNKGGGRGAYGRLWCWKPVLQHLCFVCSKGADDGLHEIWSGGRWHCLLPENVKLLLSEKLSGNMLLYFEECCTYLLVFLPLLNYFKKQRKFSCTNVIYKLPLQHESQRSHNI